MSALSYLSPRLAPIRMTWDESSPTTTSFVRMEASAVSRGLDEEGPGPPGCL